MLAHIQVNIALRDHYVEKTVETICAAARSGKNGDGLIFVYPVEDAVRFRAGESGWSALMYPEDIDVRRAQGNEGEHEVDTMPKQASC